MKSWLKPTALVALVGFGISSCMKMPDLGNNDGAQVSAEDVQSTLISAWGSSQVDATSINASEKVYFSKTAQIEGGEAREFEVDSFTVHSVDYVKDGANVYRKYGIVYSNLNYSDGNSQKPPVVTEDFYQFMMPSAVPEIAAVRPFGDVNASEGTPALSIHNFVTFLSACSPSGSWKPYCYNLKNWSTTEPAPYFTRNQGDCRGLKDCKILVKHVSFDLVSEQLDDSKGTTVRLKTIIHLQFSRDLPYLSRLLSACFKGTGKYKNQPYVANVCTEVTDFERGSVPQPPQP